MSSFRVLVAAAPPDHPCLDAVWAGHQAAITVHQAPEGTAWVKDDVEATDAGAAILASALAQHGDLQELASYLSDGDELVKTYEWFCLGIEPEHATLSPPELAILPALVHLMEGETREMAEKLVAEL